MRSFLTLAVLTALLTGPLLPQTLPNPSPSDVKLTVTTKSNQSTFRIGEIVPLELAFTSSAQGKYQLDTASYDRSGRLNEENFIVEPGTGWDDPLGLYFHSYQGFLGGGLRGSETLSPKPALIRLELNEVDPIHSAGPISSNRGFRTCFYQTPGIRKPRARCDFQPTDADYCSGFEGLADGFPTNSDRNPERYKPGSFWAGRPK